MPIYGENSEKMGAIAKELELPCRRPIKSKHLALMQSERGVGWREYKPFVSSLLIKN
jgi:hypothetical protein